MQGPTRRRVIAASIGGVLLVGTGVLVAGLVCDSMSIGGNTVSPVAGVRVPVDMTFANGFHFRMSVTDLTVAIGKISAPNANPLHPCAASDFLVSQPSSHLALTVGAGETTSLSGSHIPNAGWPQLSMAKSSVNQDGCKDASVALIYRASTSLDLL